MERETEKKFPSNHARKVKCHTIFFRLQLVNFPSRCTSSDARKRRLEFCLADANKFQNCRLQVRLIRKFLVRLYFYAESSNATKLTVVVNGKGFFT
uniref:BTB/POZ domain-containing protein n=1 Tax=Ascaris lumbricoides TaxID=6252 RepID=A0A0M3ISJ5_ASCLU